MGPHGLACFIGPQLLILEHERLQRDYFVAFTWFKIKRSSCDQVNRCTRTKIPVLFRLACFLLPNIPTILLYVKTPGIFYSLVVFAIRLMHTNKVKFRCAGESYILEHTNHRND